MAVSREEMLMQSIATGSPSNVVPVTREEKYLSFIAGESANKPNAPITRKEVFLDKIPQGGSSGGGVTIRNQNKTITENGTYTADSGYTGLGTVTVEVASGGGGSDIDALIDGTLTEVSSGATEIFDYAFYQRKSLKSVNIPNANSVGMYAFFECYALTSANFPNATSIGNYAFKNCIALTSANLTNATSIGQSVFEECRYLTSVTIPNVTSIEHSAFGYCQSLKNIDLPNVTSIGGYAFRNCTLFTSVDLSKVTSLGSYAFNNCTRLSSVIVPKVTSIPSGVFESCRALTIVDFPIATSIATKAFYSCWTLKAVILRSQKICTLSGTNVFDKCYHILGTVNSTYNPNGDKDGYFYVPRALLSDDDATKDYRRATNWSTFASQFRALEDYTVDGTITGALDESKI